MALNVLIVEDDDQDWQPIADAVDDHNDKPDNERITVTRVRGPEDLESALTIEVDIVITDVFFEPVRTERLSTVIKIIRDWELVDADRSSDRRLPIIAYTGRGVKALNTCEKHRGELFDIWDKSIASGPYIVWRLSELARELSRLRPDALLQRLIREMPEGPSWHAEVVNMAKGYDAGVTEFDQIKRAGHVVRMIADRDDDFAAAKAMWEVVEQWEMLGRAVDPEMRGHARHVINVFWLGYCVINNSLLSDWWASSWDRLKSDRRGMTSVVDQDWREALNSIWFFAALFHDTGYCVEKHSLLRQSMIALNKSFGVRIDIDDADLARLTASVSVLCNEFEEPMRSLLTNAFSATVTQEKPDHGAASAARVMAELGQRKGAYAREASRAILLHNLLPKVDGAIDWVNEPIGCLLLVCDQLQAWDRERFDTDYMRRMRPEAAELEAFKIEAHGSGRVSVRMTIDYVSPRHLRVLRELQEAVHDQLEGVLCEFPKKAIRKIGGSWPFDLEISFSLGGQRLRPSIRRA